LKIVVVGIGYVGLANAVLLAQRCEVVAVDVMQSKIDCVNERVSPIKDDDIERF